LRNDGGPAARYSVCRSATLPLLAAQHAPQLGISKDFALHVPTRAATAPTGSAARAMRMRRSGVMCVCAAGSGQRSACAGTRWRVVPRWSPKLIFRLAGP